MAVRTLQITEDYLNEFQRIIERYIPLGNEQALCHVGICSMKRCQRCQDAVKIREVLADMKGK